MRKREDIIKDGMNTRFTKENAAEMSARGREKSARTRRFAKTFREAADALLKEHVSSRDGKELNGREAMMAMLMREALKGKVQAIELMLKIAGEYPADKVQVSSELSFSEMLMRTGVKKEEGADGGATEQHR